MNEGSDTKTERGADQIGRSRELALLVACHLESYEADERAEALELAFSTGERSLGVEDSAGARIGELARDTAVARVARRRLDTLVSQGASIDATIESVSDKWRLDRMHIVERNLIRLAVVELQDESTPTAVLNAESVRLANRYGSETASRFVNGIVDALAGRLRGA